VEEREKREREGNFFKRVMTGLKDQILIDMTMVRSSKLTTSLQ